MLSEIAQINPKLTVRLDDDEPVSFLGMADVSEDGETNWGDERSFSAVRKGYTPFLNGDLLVAKITPCFENGKIAQAKTNHMHAFGSTEFHVVRVDDSQADDRYVLHLLRSPSVRTSGAKRMTGSAGQKRVPKAFLETLDVPLPPLPEQRRIADILDRADDLRAKRRRALSLLDDLTNAAFIGMFGDPASATSRYDRRAIGDLGTVVTGNTPSRAIPENFGDAIEWIKSDNLSTNADVASVASEWLSHSGRARSRTVPAGSVLVTCIAGSPNSIGNAAIVDREVAFNQQINAIIPNEEFDSWFLLYQLRNGKALVQAASTGGMKGLVSKSRFESISLLAPPRSAQQRFGEIVAAAQRMKSVQLSGLTKLDELFVSLQHRAFQGEL